jgi:hypothetical protein
MKRTSHRSVNNGVVNRRRFLSTALGTWAMSAPLGIVYTQLTASMSRSLTKEQRDGMAPSQVIDESKKGNERFVRGRWLLGII